MGIHHVSRHWINEFGENESGNACVLTTPTYTVYGPFVVTVRFSNPVTGFALGDITVTNGVASGLAGSGTTYTFTITPTATGLVTVSIPYNSVVPVNKVSNTLNVTAYYFTFTTTTTAPGQTLTLRRITPTGANVTVNWGDTGTSVILDGNVAQTTHVYALAGTYTVQITGSNTLTYIDLRDAKIGLNSVNFVPCTALTSLEIDGLHGSTILTTANISHLSLTYLSLNMTTAGATYTYNSSHLANMLLQYIYLNGGTAGTYTHNSAHYANMPLTSVFFRFTVAGTYTQNSLHFVGKSLTTLTFSFPNVVGTYVHNLAHLAGMPLTYLYNSFVASGTYTVTTSFIDDKPNLVTLLLYFNTTGAITRTINRADWDNLPNCSAITVECGLTATQVDDILLGLYTGFPSKIVAGGTVDLFGNGNAAPTGVFGPACPPTTGQEAKSELVNDSCGVSTKHYTSVTTA